MVLAWSYLPRLRFSKNDLFKLFQSNHHGDNFARLNKQTYLPYLCERHSSCSVEVMSRFRTGLKANSSWLLSYFRTENNELCHLSVLVYQEILGNNYLNKSKRKIIHKTYFVQCIHVWKGKKKVPQENSKKTVFCCCHGKKGNIQIMKEECVCRSSYCRENLTEAGFLSYSRTTLKTKRFWF